MYDQTKAEINQGVQKIAQEDEVFKDRLVSLIFLALVV